MPGPATATLPGPGCHFAARSVPFSCLGFCAFRAPAGGAPAPHSGSWPAGKGPQQPESSKVPSSERWGGRCGGSPGRAGTCPLAPEGASGRSLTHHSTLHTHTAHSHTAHTYTDTEDTHTAHAHTHNTHPHTTQYTAYSHITHTYTQHTSSPTRTHSHMAQHTHTTYTHTPHNTHTALTLTHRPI